VLKIIIHEILRASRRAKNDQQDLGAAFNRCMYHKSIAFQLNPKNCMKKNKFSLLFVAVASAVLFCQSAGATTILTVQFVDYATGVLGTANGSADLWNNPGRAEITVTNGVGSLDGTGLGLVSSAGDMASILTNSDTTGGLPNGEYTKFVASATFPPAVTTNLYTSFLYRFNVGTDVPTTGTMIAGMYLQSGGIQSAAGADAYWQVFARRVGSNIQLGIAKNVFEPTNTSPFAPGATNWAATTVGFNQTFFAVVRLQINATNGVSTVTNGVDVIDDLWINPAHASFGVAEGSVPTPSVSSPVGDGAVPTSGTGPGRFFIVGSGSSGNFDELRIATDWADVTPPLGQCLAAGITTDLTNITQSAEIGATFTVGAANSTSPSYQWQISTNGGTTYTNISGATFSTYSTPNLQLATDNGNKYRVIVSVACDGSSVTSSVSTVTLTAPVVTPNGLIMDDFFTGQVFSPPVTSDNSLWYTSLPANFTDYPGPGAIATTITNTSTLYLGYFVDESTTNLPVDLAIGQQIKVTFPFVPGGAYHDFTGNGPMRFGLFDYADGGTLITADSNVAGPGDVSGSTGNGVSVRGYMLSVDYGTNFSTATPLTLYARSGLGDVDLMGATGDFISMGSGPVGGAYSNTPAFQDGTQYTLVFSVTRISQNACSVTAAITNSAGTNWTFTATDTNGFGYHRFDSFTMRPNTRESADDTFSIPEFKVEVLTPPVTSPTNIIITSVSRSGNNVTLGWSATPAGTYTFSVLNKTNLAAATWSTNQTGISATTYMDTTATPKNRFYKVTSP
jgi:hypothetical protein